MFQNTDINLTYYTGKKIKPDEKKETTEFAWIADITITKNNARKIVNAGRNRWKIENLLLGKLFHNDRSKSHCI